ncbi:MAG TPA: M56 family metallopeptidase, partial [Gemmataceae bacterium]|nr:M56 family metallopeptidase [Gemmataceae bacterium]
EPAALDVVPLAGSEEPAGVEAPVALDSVGTLTQPRSPMPLWPQLLSIVWAVGALVWFCLALKRLHRFRRLLRFAHPASAALQERTRRLAQALELKRCPRVRLLSGRVAPMLWAIGGSPRLLVPADLVDLLNDEQLDTLLLHELAHLRRRDHWVRVLEFVVMGLYWWHPVVWYARRELRETEEQCCDAWVVSTLPGAGRTYASALLDTLDFLSTAQSAVPPLASGLGQIADLKRRLTMIMRGNTPRSLTWPGCLAVVALGLTLLPMLPSLHGQPPSKDEAKKLLHLQQEAQKFRDESRAEVEHQKALIAVKKAEIKRAEAELKAAEVQAAAFEERLRKHQAERSELAKKEKAAVAESKKKVTYRLEIILPADGSVNANEIAEKIRKVLPEKLHGSMLFRPVPVPTYSWAVPPHAVPNVSNLPEKRINDLEKKLEKVLHELHELRNQMKEPRFKIAPPAVINPAKPADPTRR